MSNCNGVSLVLVARAVGLNWGWVGSWHLSRYPFVMSALNSVFNQWRISAKYDQWNISGEPCSGAAIDTTVLWNIDSTDYNPGIRCDCNGTVCHITQLKVIMLDVFGGIPEELWSLTSLTHLNLARNYLTGPLSSSIAYLTQMQYLSVGINALSGEVPKELGKLTNLIVFYFDSSGVSGAIPSTFAALQNLQILWGSDNELTGSIPEFIGNWSKLRNLRISDLSNGSSSLAFLKDMTSLSTLILRNNNISGTIPSNIGDFQSLSQLDLSFNNLTGPIPDSLFNSSSLVYLFLGNNKLNGTPPPLKSPSLLHIDVSYNQLSAALPSWANNSVMATGFDCIPENLPCLGDIRSSPKYSDFAINCGGPEITSSSQIVYDWDNETLGPATYYEASTKRWAVSNVGLFNDKNDAQYLSFSSSQFTTLDTTLDTELLQTVRISPGSLRYFGLGLENGNYSVTLNVAEIAFLNPPTWKSLGRRVFDIYIQAWHVHENNREVELVDARLLEFDEEEVKRVIGVALLCTQTSPQQRPSMPRVVAMLSGDIEVSAVTSGPGYFTNWNFDTTSFMTADTTPSAENEHSQFKNQKRNGYLGWDETCLALDGLMIEELEGSYRIDEIGAKRVSERGENRIMGNGRKGK
ncbi:hypothetical protein RHGRI_027247 [Rhododendron griersonianum]|uniref:non-specific serine/threonine protein kinase n=1 Tax=Rhododendron griersonianum TaxID=479676 RepID=A0AAV6IZY3_9ERIC|nr:hypothetical protein RHGRI_027247 [Rhododendron griersonianum]